MKLFNNPNKTINEKFTPFNATLTILTDNILDFIIFYESKHNTADSIVSHSKMEDKELYDYNKNLYSEYKEVFSVGDKDYKDKKDKRVKQYLKQNKITPYNNYNFNFGNHYCTKFMMQFINKDIFYLDDYIEDKSKPVEWYCKFHSIYNFRYIMCFRLDRKIFKDKIKHLGFENDFISIWNSEYFIEVRFSFCPNLDEEYNNLIDDLILLKFSIFRDIPHEKEVLIYSSYINLPLLFCGYYYEYNMAMIKKSEEIIKIIEASKIENDLSLDETNGSLMNHMFSLEVLNM